jgi:hypothetical protein
LKSKNMGYLHTRVKSFTRTDGASAVRGAAYISSSEILDERTGEHCNFTPKKGTRHSEITLPADAPEWASDRSQLWNKAEKAETRINSCVQREIEMELPRGLSQDVWKELARNQARRICKDLHVAVDWSIHVHPKNPDNPHCHFRFTTRELHESGFGAKTRQMNIVTQSKVIVAGWRKAIATDFNAAMAHYVLDRRFDARSFKEQGIEQQPTIHVGRGPGRADREAENVLRIDARTAKPEPAIDTEIEALEGELAQVQKELEAAMLELSTMPEKPTIEALLRDRNYAKATIAALTEQRDAAARCRSERKITQRDITETGAKLKKLGNAHSAVVARKAEIAGMSWLQRRSAAGELVEIAATEARMIDDYKAHTARLKALHAHQDSLPQPLDSHACIKWNQCVENIDEAEAELKTLGRDMPAITAQLETEAGMQRMHEALQAEKLRIENEKTAAASIPDTSTSLTMAPE